MAVYRFIKVSACSVASLQTMLIKSGAQGILWRQFIDIGQVFLCQFIDIAQILACSFSSWQSTLIAVCRSMRVPFSILVGFGAFHASLVSGCSRKHLSKMIDVV